ncbi:PE-PPE domain-containing protein [Nocardia sp. MDA0666]|uniref:PE-PPE domain-containing protein n=1 Tax=Nocardia sp. MDA0666 TaxID=2135448 RepID=UPI000D11FCC9|nr:PE-PPE domain-containing protein [Nocardia sp. MDA0666]PSR68616.1 PE-PPE domain-containing protein [Nocardia sp. MDA0666]
MITVLTCRGTGEPLGSPANMLAAVTRQLDPAIYEIGPDIDYPAAIGPANPRHGVGGCSEQQSIDQGITALVRAIHATPNRVGLLGYSLGAEVVTRFLEAKARGEYADCELAWAANLANPLRMRGDSIDPNPVGFGINGQRRPWPDEFPTWEVANPADGITSCPPDSPLRTLADTVSAFSFADMGGWTRDLADRIRRNRWQAMQFGSWSHPIRIWDLWSQAAALMEGYLNGGQHTTAYITGGFCDRLAAILNRYPERG